MTHHETCVGVHGAECDCGAEAFAEIKVLADSIPTNPVEAVVHLRSIFDWLSRLAMVAADQRWPGFEDLALRLLEVESSLLAQGGPKA